jgi:hypothetical protein
LNFCFSRERHLAEYLYESTGRRRIKMFSILKNEQEVIANLGKSIETIANESISARGDFFIGFSGKSSIPALSLQDCFNSIPQEDPSANISAKLFPKSRLTGASGLSSSATSDTCLRTMRSRLSGERFAFVLINGFATFPRRF